MKLRRLQPAVFACAAALICAAVQAIEREPAEWLQQMSHAVKTTSYEGTVIHITDGAAEALKVIHTVKDGVVREKVIAQEGNGLEIIRNGNEVHCILPDRKSVLVEEWDDQSTLFSTLPSSEIRFGSEYDVAVIRKDRVAGRETMILAIRPHDGYRYGHRIWLDTATGFPLKTQLIAEDGAAIEQVKFADIALNKEIDMSALSTSYATENFVWLQQPSDHVTTDIESNWHNSSLPAGFVQIDSHEESMSGSDERVTHLMFSDGLANVSVFIATSSGDLVEGPARVGGSNSYSVESSGHEITAIGEVPALTVREIASNMVQR